LSFYTYACTCVCCNLVALSFFFFKQKTAYEIGLGIPAEPLSDLEHFHPEVAAHSDSEQLTKNQAVATSQEAVQNQNEPQLRDENAHNDKSVHGVLNPTYQAGLRQIGRASCRDRAQSSTNAETHQK